MILFECMKIGGGIRIHDEIAARLFLLGVSEEKQHNRLVFIEAFEYGVPPHGGLAFVLDRLVITYK